MYNFARIYAGKCKKQYNVSVDELENFVSDTFDAQETPKVQFLWKNTKTHEKLRVQVLFVAETLQNLEREVEKKRFHVPKLSQSFSNNTDNDDGQEELRQTRQQTKNKRREQKKSQNERSNIIIDTFLAQNESSIQKETFCIDSEEIERRYLSPNPNDDKIEEELGLLGTQVNLHKTEDELQKEIGHLKEQLAMKQIECEKLRKKYERYKYKYKELKNAGEFPLTEKTGKKLLELSQSATHNTDFEEGEENNEEDNVLRSDITIIRGMPIKTVCLLDAKRQDEPSKFISNICRGMWDRQSLGNRCVKRSKSCQRPELSPRKVQCILKEFNSWLRNKEYNRNCIATQMKLAPKYFGRAVSAARKKLKYVENTEQQ